MTNPTLGERLKQINDRTTAEAKAELLRKQAAVDAKKAAEQRQVKEFFDHLKTHAEASILAGEKPDSVRLGHPESSFKEVASLLECYKYTNGDTFLKSVLKGPYEPIYLGFEQWLQENGLRVSANYDYDGGGMYSWFTFQVEPL